MFYGYGYYSSMIFLLPAIILTMFAQSRVNSAYATYARVMSRRGLTGAQVARMILDRNGLTGVTVEMTQGRLSDHYDPRKGVMRLSPAVYREASIASACIAAHESGHAIQHGRSYMPLMLRNAIAPLVSLVSNLAWPLLIVGLMLGRSSSGNVVFGIGVLFFLGAVIFQLITLPVEFNASRRALAQLSEMEILYPEENEGAKKVLSAAALTYVAALAMAVANLIRILAMRGRD
ncbi:zinc metallopeptidase [Bacilliculturomica massiliensis]|uniref:zinc metallopeptidase n=1 Tax=Bacilliculturomica massiliensis TaxID=1917867 RepID=UPI0010325E98|nr:zinc metallopeptidase [Bacilliculturomica massiliensis]